MPKDICCSLVRYTRHRITSGRTDIGIVIIWTQTLLTTMAADLGRRSSPRLQARAEEEERLAEEARLEAQRLPADGSLDFYFYNETSRSGAFEIRYKELYQTADNADICLWAIEAFWNVSTFYPGQILKFAHTFPQSDPEAMYNADIGPYASTDFGPVGKDHILDLLSCLSGF
jgi:hypothetical protein